MVPALFVESIVREMSNKERSLSRWQNGGIPQRDCNSNRERDKPSQTLLQNGGESSETGGNSRGETRRNQGGGVWEVVRHESVV